MNLMRSKISETEQKQKLKNFKNISLSPASLSILAESKATPLPPQPPELSKTLRSAFKGCNKNGT